MREEKITSALSMVVTDESVTLKAVSGWSETYPVASLGASLLLSTSGKERENMAAILFSKTELLADGDFMTKTTTNVMETLALRLEGRTE